MIFAPQTSLRAFIADGYLRHYPDLSPKTVYQHWIAFDLFGGFLSREPLLVDLNPDAVGGFLLDYHQRAKVATPTVNSKRSKLLAWWKLAWEFDLLESPPKRVPRWREPQLVPRAWTAQQFSALVRTASRASGSVGRWPAADWFPALLLGCFSTAARTGALMALRTHDVDLATRFVLFFSSKTGKQEFHRLTPQAADAVRRIWADERPLLYGDWPYDGDFGYPALRKAIKRLVAEAKIPPFGTFKAIRRTAYSMVAAAGGLELARRFVYHSSTAVGIKHYYDPRLAGGGNPSDHLPTLDL